MKGIGFVGLILVFAFGLGLRLVYAGGGGAAEIPKTEAAPTDATPTAVSSCLAENDCDADGMPAAYDADDNDPTVTTSTAEYDSDGDGFADHACRFFTINDDESITNNMTGEVFARNYCDNCRINNDQTDSDGNGVGDACDHSHTNQAAQPIARPANPVGSGTQQPTGVITQHSGTVQTTPVATSTYDRRL